MSKKDPQDWRDDILTAIELAIAIIFGLMFFNYLESNPAVAAVLQPTTLGMLIISFGLFLGAFLFVKWLNREKV